MRSGPALHELAGRRGTAHGPRPRQLDNQTSLAAALQGAIRACLAPALPQCCWQTHHGNRDESAQHGTRQASLLML